jgi:hypothetical protein
MVWCENGPTDPLKFWGSHGICSISGGSFLNLGRMLVYFKAAGSSLE